MPCVYPSMHSGAAMRFSRPRWEKKGLIYRPDARVAWMKSHCQLPVADQLDGSRYRVYFASRDELQRSHIGCIEIDLHEPVKVLGSTVQPILSPGPTGHFDEHGVYPSSIVTVGNKKYLYFIGWNRGCRQPLFYASIGLAVSEDGGRSFERLFRSPIMARSEHDPCLVTSPNVFIDNDLWRMTYVSGIRWEESADGGLKSVYHIKYAESRDGISWTRDGTVAIDFASKDETNIARSSVLKFGGAYRMWYSTARLPVRPYRIGYAESDDGTRWTRIDEGVGFDVSDEGFDSEMICYPHVIHHENKLYMFYNGNGFGREGIGLAVADDSEASVAMTSS
ncbi:conserved protein of unknown function [Nitrospira japonica]|uniref:Glycosyl hydrolase family 32 N-terminal domain-containing protein n=1 Tax=Nitrospira japonica TaxID=1325564 RepID=A0A1W1IB80_9BACT|nr:conserved protein of unknown function [Nitrospira japonica]